MNNHFFLSIVSNLGENLFVGWRGGDGQGGRFGVVLNAAHKKAGQKARRNA
jgi:hypothetical protein